MTLAVAYVVTHHPKVALTFIDREVRALEASGVRVVPCSINDPSPEDTSSPAGAAEAARTFYIKRAGAVRALRALTAAIAVSPLGFASLAWRAVRSAGTDVRTVVWRLLHLVEGAMVWHRLRGDDVRHLHAHFGQTPSTIAWFATEIGNLDEPGRWSWSFTIHGFQDFVNERDARLDLKAESASFIVCVSDFTRSQLMRITRPELWPRYEIVRCGVDPEQFAYRPRLEVADRPCIAIVARVSPEKGHMVLVHAVSILRDRGLDVVVDVVGGGGFAADVEVEATRSGVADRIRFIGELQSDQVADRLATADVYCLPSFAEGLPVSIMEAMATGIPVVSTYISGIPEIVEHRRTGLTVPAGNAEALADALYDLLTDRALRGDVVAAARLEVERHYDTERNVAELRELFRAAIDAKGAHGSP